MKFNFGFDLNKEKEPAPIKISHTQADVLSVLSRHLLTIFLKLPTYQPIVVICVGTDRSTGDSLGPLVGSRLAKKREAGLHLFGTLADPVHAMNLSETIDQVHRQFRDPFIVAIDACLGQLSSVGCIQIAIGPLKPGAGVNKDLPPVGDIHITGIVNVGGFMEYFVLQNTRLNLVMNMAEVIADSLYASLQQSYSYSSNPIILPAAAALELE